MRYPLVPSDVGISTIPRHLSMVHGAPCTPKLTSLHGEVLHIVGAPGARVGSPLLATYTSPAPSAKSAKPNKCAVSTYSSVMDFDLRYDPSIKGMVLKDTPEPVDPKLQLELTQLNTLMTEMIGLNNQHPPKPTPETFNKDMSTMIRKLYEGGVNSFKQAKYVESVKQFTIAIEVINRRNKFEAFQGTLQELSLLLMSRTDAYLKCKEYMKAFNDADMLINMMMCTADNFLRRGVSNYFLGNYEDARADYQRGLAFDENDKRLIGELNVCLDKILEENGDYLEPDAAQVLAAAAPVAEKGSGLSQA